MQNHQLINQTSGKTDYRTPQFILDSVREVLGEIDLDPASGAWANEFVKAKRFFTKKDDGLKQRWTGRVWMNHPFSRAANRHWVAKLVEAYRSGDVPEALCITYASTSEAWFQPLLDYPMCFLSPRTNYFNRQGEIVRGVSKGSAVTYFGSDDVKFARRFSKWGKVKI